MPLLVLLFTWLWERLSPRHHVRYDADTPPAPPRDAMTDEEWQANSL